MTRSDMTRALDEEIQRLQQVRRLLSGSQSLTPALAGLATLKPAKSGHKISPEGRRRIAEAQKRRWARERAM